MTAHSSMLQRVAQVNGPYHMICWIYHVKNIKMNLVEI